jgi:ketosteroid isomerase-like protein
VSTLQRPRDLDPGEGRVLGRRRATFDLAAYVAALERRDLVHQLACYAPDATVCVVDPDSPPPGARTIAGTPAIRAWLDGFDAPGVEITHVVDGGDRVALTGRWRRRDGTAVVATSTAELRDGLITAQHTVLVWARPRVDPVDGWTRVSEGLWTRTG